MDHDLHLALDLQGLRAGFLRHTRRAFQRLTLPERPRILDIGCGDGAITLELARLSDGEILGIDVDDQPLAEFHRRIDQAALGRRVRIKRCSLLESALPLHHFHLLWEEGVLHLLDSSRGIERCAELLLAGGVLVSCETVEWIESNLERFGAAGFQIMDRLPWPPGSWWTEYYAPLQRRIQRLRAETCSEQGLATLDRLEAEAIMVRDDPRRFDCAHLLLRLNP